MNRFRIIILVLVCSLVSACSAQQSTPTEAPTEISVPTSTFTIAPSPTSTPLPTATTEPTITPVPIPSEIQEVFSGINLVWRDDFTYRGMAGTTPLGWSNMTDTDDNRRVRIIDGDVLKIDQPDHGIMYAYTTGTLGPGTGVYVKFKYAGMKNVFTLGMDAIDDTGQMYSYRTENYHSFAFYVENNKRLIHAIEGPYIKTLKSAGDLKLVEDTWYNLILAVTPENEFVIQIWNSQEPDNRWTTWYTAEKINQYYFVGWIDKGRTVFLDDFTFFQFDTTMIAK
jgi:hypothetical protein